MPYCQPEKSLPLCNQAFPIKNPFHWQVNPVTAYGLLETLQVPKGEWVLQTAAGSVLGRVFIALAKHRGLRTINVVRRSAQKQELLQLGCALLSLLQCA